MPAVKPQLGPVPAEKAPERPCKGCGATIPAQPASPGRPRQFCSRSCRRDYFHQREKDELERERAERGAQQWELERFRTDQWQHGTREAERRARQRAKLRKDS